MGKKFIAYEGEKFTIEWYLDSNGKSIAREYYENLTTEQQAKLYHLFLMLADTGVIYNIQKFRNEGDKIYAFKPMPDRFLCFFYQGGKVIVTNAFEKKQDKMPIREKERALKLRSDYIKRCVEGDYYA